MCLNMFQCDDFVKLYGPDVIKLLAQYADPQEVCTVSVTLIYLISLRGFFVQKLVLVIRISW